MSIATEQGIVPDLDENLYHAHEALSQSQMKVLLDCPAKYKWSLTHPQPHRDVFDLGHAIHGKILGVGLDVVQVDADSWRGKAAQEAKAAARAEGKVPLLAADVAKVDAIAESVLAHRAARAILEAPGTYEESMFWTDPETGVQCRGRVDKRTALADGTPALVDLKSTADASPAGFAKSVWNFGYHMQRGTYTAGHEAITGETPGFYFIAVEKEPPHLVGVYVLDATAIYRGEQMYRDALDLYVRCTEADYWPGYADEITELASPRWAS